MTLELPQSKGGENTSDIYQGIARVSEANLSSKCRSFWLLNLFLTKISANKIAWRIQSAFSSCSLWAITVDYIFCKNHTKFLVGSSYYIHIVCFSVKRIKKVKKDQLFTDVSNENHHRKDSIKALGQFMRKRNYLYNNKIRSTKLMWKHVTVSKANSWSLRSQSCIILSRCKL